MEFQQLIYASDGRVARITLNRPERLNALSKVLVHEIVAAIALADNDPEIRVIIVTGAGDKAFSAGYDMKESAEAPRRTLAGWRARMQEDIRFTYAPWECSKPVICMINGFCLAGALEFAQCCDIRYCSDNAEFGVVETRFASGVATMIMPWIIGNRCRELIYTGDRFGAAEARRLGLVDRVFPKAELEAATMKVARRIGQVATDCLKWNKRAINQTFETMGMRAAIQYGSEAAAMMNGTGSPEAGEFDAIRRAQGLGAALQWRNNLFAEFE
jgi:enoyl-CoA hydratase/carnithine racemase